MTDLEALEWCEDNGATVHFRHRSRTQLEVLIQFADDITATAPTLPEAIAGIERKRRGRRAPAIPAHDPLVPYALHDGFLRDDAVPHLATRVTLHRSIAAGMIEWLRGLADL